MANGDTFPPGAGRDTLPQGFPAGMRVLVVEDDPSSLHDLTQILESSGYKVTRKASPREALRAVEQNRTGFDFDIVMTVVHGDDGGAGFDGVDLLKRIRGRYPVITFSSDNAVEMVMRTIKKGACYFRSKPLRHEEVRNIWIHVVKWRREEGSEVDDPDEGGSDGSQQGSDEIQGPSNNENPHGRK
uniref:Response regulatory domain-containing protein n=1 Tax=Triticum urartu TaxID=4572 RepID=A0A8R7UMM0_TRIUA